MRTEKKGFIIFILFSGFLLLDGCYLFGTEDSEVETPTYQFSAQVLPEGAGNVNPATGDFEQGSQLIVEAEANDGWEFSGWSGDINSPDNPLELTLERDTELTANFNDFRSIYSMELLISDDTNELELAIGQNPQPFLLDREAPPPPPENALHAWFDRNGERLFADFRSEVQRQVVWQMMYQTGSGEDLTLNWVLEEEKMEGILRLLTDDGSVLIDDIRGEGEFTFTADEHDYIEFRYEVD